MRLGRVRPTAWWSWPTTSGPGRGRLGRTWSAPPGASLLVSVLLRPGLAPEERHVVVVAAAVAMAEAVAVTTGVLADLKWPNDLLVGDRKLAGILAESVGDAVVVGHRREPRLAARSRPSSRGSPPRATSRVGARSRARSCWRRSSPGTRSASPISRRRGAGTATGS